MNISDLPKGLYWKNAIINFDKYRLSWMCQHRRDPAIIYMSGFNLHTTLKYFVVGICRHVNQIFPPNNGIEYYASAVGEIETKRSSFYHKELIRHE